MSAKKIKMWTQAYRPFILGGNVHAPLACKVLASGPYDLGKGYTGYLALSPQGKSYIVESTTGGIVGNTIEEVRADIKDAHVGVMRKQIAEALEQAKKAHVIPENEFWAYMEKNS
jgi:hypothetical protein